MGNKVSSLSYFLFQYVNLFNILLVNLFKIKTFVDTFMGKDLKVIVGKLKWLNEYPFVKDLITADSDSSDNAIF